MINFFSDFSDNIVKLFTSISFSDVLDILVITVALFYIIKLFKNTRAIHLLRGLILLVIVYALVTVFDMPTSSFVFGKLFSNIVLVLILLFQPEIRHAIESFGRGRFNISSLFKSNSSLEKKKINSDISSIVNSCIHMSEEKIGALIVLEGKSPLTDIEKTGSKVDAAISSPVIENIFFPKAPLHDGAMIIGNGRISAAGCILPLTEARVSLDLGTRHRAAIGLSENVDALIVVVSEETGTISVAKDGKIVRGLTSAELVENLTKFLMPRENDKDDEKKKEVAE